MGYLGLQPPARRVMVRARRGEVRMLRALLFLTIFFKFAVFIIMPAQSQEKDYEKALAKVRFHAENLIRLSLVPGTDFKLTSFHDQNAKNLCGTLAIRDSYGRLGGNQLFAINLDNRRFYLLPNHKLPIASDEDFKERTAIMKIIKDLCNYE